jgi:prophage maintenance system killer protein
MFLKVHSVFLHDINKRTAVMSNLAALPLNAILLRKNPSVVETIKRVRMHGKND